MEKIQSKKYVPWTNYINNFIINYLLVSIF